MRIVPVDAKTNDWPRKVADAVNGNGRDIFALQKQFQGLGDYADDSAAASGGVPVGGLYRTGSQVMVRVS